MYMERDFQNILLFLAFDKDNLIFARLKIDISVVNGSKPSEALEERYALKKQNETADWFY